MISNEVIEKLDDIDQKLSYSKNKYKTEEKKMFKVYFPFQWLVKGILLVLLGLILFGSYLTIKARHFPEEKANKNCNNRFKNR